MILKYTWRLYQKHSPFAFDCQEQKLSVIPRKHGFPQLKIPLRLYSAQPLVCVVRSCPVVCRSDLWSYFIRECHLPKVTSDDCFVYPHVIQNQALLVWTHERSQLFLHLDILLMTVLFFLFAIARKPFRSTFFFRFQQSLLWCFGPAVTHWQS